MSLPLFRHEVVQARRARWLGAVVLDHPPGAAWGMALCALAAALVLATLANGEYTRRTPVAGQLVPSLGTAVVVAPVAGVVAALHVEEDEAVPAGAELLAIRVPTATVHGDDGAAIAASVERRREATREAYASRRRRLAADADALERQLAGARAEAAAIDAEAATRDRQIALAAETLARYQALHASRLVADLQLRQQQAAVLEQQAAREGLARQRAGLVRLQAQLAQSLASLPEQEAQLDADEARELAAFDQEAAEQRVRRGAAVGAPFAGRVGTTLVQPGQAVQAGQALLTVLPAAGELQAHLRVPGRAIAFVAEGDRVRLRFDAFPYQRYGHAGGTVVRLSRDAVAGADGEPVYRVVVALDRQTMPGADRVHALRAGLAVQAELRGDTRPLWQWALEPLRTLQAAAPSLPTSASDDGVRETRDGASAARSSLLPSTSGRRRRVRARPAPRRPARAARAGVASRRSPRRSFPCRLAADPGKHGLVGLPAIGGHQQERVMRELTMVELEQVEGGNPVVIGAIVGAGVIALAGIAVVAYGVSEGCSGSVTISTEEIKIEVTCPPPGGTGG